MALSDKEITTLYFEALGSQTMLSTGYARDWGGKLTSRGHAGTCAARRREGAVLSNPQIKVNAMSYAKLIRLMDERVKLGLPALPTKEHP